MDVRQLSKMNTRTPYHGGCKCALTPFEAMR